MTGEELKTMTESILDDTVNEMLFYQLANVAKNTIENERPWMFLRAVDSSQTATNGDNTNISRALPTLWRRTYKLLVGDRIFTQVPFDEKPRTQFGGGVYCIDVANSVYYLLGTIGSASTIYHNYIKKTNAITSATSPVWDSDFHPIIAYMVAAYVMTGVDADDIFARMSPENKLAATALLNSMRAMDTQLQIDAQGGRLGMDSE